MTRKPVGPSRFRMRVHQTYAGYGPHERFVTVAFIDFGRSPSAKIELDQYPAFDGDEAWFWVDRWNAKRFTIVSPAEPPPGYQSPFDTPQAREIRAYRMWEADPNARPEDMPPIPSSLLSHGRFGATPEIVERERAIIKARRIAEAAGEPDDPK